MSVKWKLSVLSLEKKHMILSHLEKGEKAVNLASEFQITKQQVLENIKHFANNFETSNSLQRKLLKSAKNKEWDRCVKVWFIQEHSKGTPVCGVLLQEKAWNISMIAPFAGNVMFWNKRTFTSLNALNKKYKDIVVEVWCVFLLTLLVHVFKGNEKYNNKNLSLIYSGHFAWLPKSLDNRGWIVLWDIKRLTNTLFKKSWGW